MFKDFHGYQIYDDGTIFSTKTKRWLKFDYPTGYAQVQLSINGESKRFKVHRLVAFMFCNPPENYYELTVDHVNGDHIDNRACNLEWVTMRENNIRARKNGQNNVSQSNSDRWLNEEFRVKTSQRFSEVRNALGLSRGKNNGNFRYDIRNQNGDLILMADLVTMMRKSLTTVWKKVRKYVQGEYVPEFESLGIVSITDLKDTVNRLSKAKDSSNESENKAYKIVRTKRIE